MKGRSILEPLEGRQLFSGNVAVSYNALTDTILIAGDTKPNEVQVTLPGSGFKYVVTGLNGTMINGAPAITVPVGPGGASSFRVGLGDGDDGMFFEPGFYDDVQISMLAGNDHVRLKTSNVFGDLDILTGDGDDTVELKSGVDVFGKLYISTGSGVDKIALSSIPTERVLGSVFIDGGTGRDSMTGSFFIVGGTLSVMNIETLIP